jgi:hypothetical protein
MVCPLDAVIVGNVLDLIVIVLPFGDL